MKLSTVSRAAGEIGTVSLDAPSFRRRVLRPAEGVFLFHPRALERLIQSQRPGASIPAVPYCLMARGEFLAELEWENPEALSVIEGLAIPVYVILLPMPSEQALRERNPTALLRDYWMRRFEAEVARAWQMARDDNRDEDRFGTPALVELIGSPALDEVRSVLEHDGAIPMDLGDDEVCRHFIGMVVRLRYFAPGSRGFFFPAVRDWEAVDRWLGGGGLDLPSPRTGTRFPLLLLRSQPTVNCGLPAHELLLPQDLPYDRSDPDRSAPPGHGDSAVDESLAAADRDVPPTLSLEFECTADTSELASLDVARRCMDVLRESIVLKRRRSSLRGRSTAIVNALVAPLVRLLLALRDRLFGRDAVVSNRWSDAIVLLVRHEMRRGLKAELASRYAVALLHSIRVRHLCGRLPTEQPGALQHAAELLAHYTSTLEGALSDMLAAAWRLPPAQGRVLRELIRQLVEARADQESSRAAAALLLDLQVVLLAGHATYHRLQPVVWLFSLGREPWRRILPFQGRLKALHALHDAANQLERMPWGYLTLDRYAALLNALYRDFWERLEEQLAPLLQRSLEAAGFEPRTHQQHVAAHKVREELLDVIKRRWHVRFMDMRDIVARNVYRLPDTSPGQMLFGDYLTRFDRIAAYALPGIYQRGEFYIKGLQWLGAPLFGTRPGRLLVRYVVIPFGSAIVALEIIEYAWAHLIAGPHPTLATWEQIALFGLIVNFSVNTDSGRHYAIRSWQIAVSIIEYVLFKGVAQLLRWGPIARLLETDFSRSLSRYVLQPLLIGFFPLLAWSLTVGSVAPLTNGTFFAFAFAIGTLGRNTPLGRRFIDDLVTSLGIMWRRLNQALIAGLVRQLLNFFKELTRAFSQRLHQIRALLAHRLGEGLWEASIKALLAPVWRLIEGVVEFYVNVLVEPQVNPIKHFPTVTVAHKFLLPFLPALTTSLNAHASAIVPTFIAFPFVALTIMLFPGLFGFLVWELKENWRLYAANHPGPPAPAVIGSHGENLRGLLRRGFHSGTVPKVFDKMRRAIVKQFAHGDTATRELRRVVHRLHEVEGHVRDFAERELAFAIRQRCRGQACGLKDVAVTGAYVATTEVEFHLEITPDKASGEPITLLVRVELEDAELLWEAEIRPSDPSTAALRAAIENDLEVFALRCGARRRAERAEGIS